MSEHWSSWREMLWPCVHPGRALVLLLFPEASIRPRTLVPLSLMIQRVLMWQKSHDFWSPWRLFWRTASHVLALLVSCHPVYSGSHHHHLPAPLPPPCSWVSPLPSPEAVSWPCSGSKIGARGPTRTDKGGAATRAQGLWLAGCLAATKPAAILGLCVGLCLEKLAVCLPTSSGHVVWLCCLYVLLMSPRSVALSRGWYWSGLVSCGLEPILLMLFMFVEFCTNSSLESLLTVFLFFVLSISCFGLFRCFPFILTSLSCPKMK